jgi:hypothetical protein
VLLRQRAKTIEEKRCDEGEQGHGRNGFEEVALCYGRRVEAASEETRGEIVSYGLDRALWHVFIDGHTRR